MITTFKTLLRLEFEKEKWLNQKKVIMSYLQYERKNKYLCIIQAIKFKKRKIRSNLPKTGMQKEQPWGSLGYNLLR